MYSYMDDYNKIRKTLTIVLQIEIVPRNWQIFMESYQEMMLSREAFDFSPFCFRPLKQYTNRSNWRIETG